MSVAKQKQAAKKFAEFWKGKGYEKGESQIFWTTLLRDVFGVERPEEIISFEEQVRLDHTSFIDAMIPSSKVLIEQKGLGKDLDKPIKQSDGSMLTPFKQAKRYIAELPYSKHPRWVVTCNFAEFRVYDMERPGGEPQKILLADLEKEYYRLAFLAERGNSHVEPETRVSVEAGRIVGLLYDAILKQYKDPTSAEALRGLNILCVRLVFCLYAEDAGVFGRRAMFHDYLEKFDAVHMRKALIELFRALDTKPEDRDPYLEPELDAFPYVNGGLFAEENAEIPMFTDEIRNLLLQKASAEFDWSEISPTIFGAVFESTLNPATRRSGGMHYTSVENIHKVIGPLFLDGLKREFEEIRALPVERTRARKLANFRKKLASLTFLDPACGSGNFLTETYLSLRRLENDALREFLRGQISFASFDSAYSPIQVSIGQFYGVEINDFAVSVAKTALWIAESQMMRETEDIVKKDLDFLPLKTNANIVEGNALRIDWESVAPKEKLNYIMGNPPFVGYSLQSKEQKSDILSVYTDENGKPYKAAGKIDYVSAWFFKAARLMRGTSIRAALVATNSVTQGEQVADVWKPLYERFGIHIDFAHRTFRWDSEANLKAHVHCVIVGFSAALNDEPKRIYAAGRVQEAKTINAYLVDAPVIFIESRSVSICDVPKMVYGSKPADGGFLFLTPDEREELLKKEPETAKFIRKILGADEYTNNKERYCLWLLGASPSELRKSKFIMNRIEQVKNFRLQSVKAATQKSANTPTLFQELRQPNSEYIIIPSVSSEMRRYIPCGFISPDVIVNNAVHIIPNATLYHFGVLTSSVHMAWTRAVCGRLEMRYRYSKDVVYNNFPWPEPTDAQKARIEQTARGILNARSLYPDSSLADLYDDAVMPAELRAAHRDNDRAVADAYGFSVRDMTESAVVAELMRMYRRLAEGRE